MKRPRKLPSEADLRRAMDRTVEAIVGQQMIGGVPGQSHDALKGTSVPNVKAAEDYARPIIEKIARTQDMETPVEEKPAPERDADELARRGKVELKYQSRIVRTPMGALRDREKPKKDSPLTTLKRKRIKLLMQDPSWRDQILKARFDANGRVPWKTVNGKVVEDTARTDKQILEVLEKSNELFGDWKKENRALVFGLGG